MNAALFAAITDDDDEDAIADLLTDVDGRDEEGRSPLEHACAVGAWKCAEALLAAGATPAIPAALVLAHDEALEPDDKSMLVNAIDAGAPRLAACVLATGTPVDRVTAQGWSALHYAAGAAQADLCGALLDRGLPIDARTRKGDTPLAMAVQARQKSAAAVALLVARGADVHVVDHEGKGLVDKIRTKVAEQRAAIIAALGVAPAPVGPDRTADARARIERYLGQRVSAALDGTLFGHVPATFWFGFDAPDALQAQLRDDLEDETRGWNWREVVPVASVHAPEGGGAIAWLFLDYRAEAEPRVQVHASDAFGHARTVASLDALGLEVVGPRQP